MATVVVWDGKAVFSKATTQVLRNTDNAAGFVEDVVVQSISRPFRGDKRVSRKKGFQRTASSEGEPPKLRTGELFRSITHETGIIGTDVVGRVGTNLEYAARLEYGFVGTDSRGRNINQGARPFLRPPLKLFAGTILSLIAGGTGAGTGLSAEL